MVKPEVLTLLGLMPGVSGFLQRYHCGEGGCYDHSGPVTFTLRARKLKLGEGTNFRGKRQNEDLSGRAQTKNFIGKPFIVNTEEST